MCKVSLRTQIAYRFLLILVGIYVLLPVWCMVRMALDGSAKGAPKVHRVSHVNHTSSKFCKALHGEAD